MDRIYYLYTHTSPSGKVYVGQTVNIQNRWGHNGNSYLVTRKNGKYQHPPFARAIIKYGWENFKHEILLECHSKSEVDYAERYLIKWYKLHHLSYNITDGGEGVLGKPLTEHQKKCLRDGYNKYWNSLTEEEKNNITAHNKESRRKLQGRPVYAFDANTKKFVAKYDSVSRAAEIMHTTSCCIRRAARGSVPWASGYIWSFSPNINPDNPIYKKRKSRKGSLFCYNLKGEFIKEFSSMKEAVAFAKGIHVGISACCRSKLLQYKGYIWRRALVDIEPYILNKLQRRLK